MNPLSVILFLFSSFSYFTFFHSIVTFKESQHIWKNKAVVFNVRVELRVLVRNCWYYWLIIYSSFYFSLNYKAFCFSAGSCETSKWAVCDGTPCVCTILVGDNMKQKLDCTKCKFKMCLYSDEPEDKASTCKFLVDHSSWCVFLLCLSLSDPQMLLDEGWDVQG